MSARNPRWGFDFLAPTTAIGSARRVSWIEAYIESLVAHGDPIPGPVEIERVTVAA